MPTVHSTVQCTVHCTLPGCRITPWARVTRTPATSRWSDKKLGIREKHEWRTGGTGGRPCCDNWCHVFSTVVSMCCHAGYLNLQTVYTVHCTQCNETLETGGQDTCDFCDPGCLTPAQVDHAVITTLPPVPGHPDTASLHAINNM